MKKQKKHLKTYTSNSNIEELITYSGLPQHKHLPYATKQMIAREVELEKMRMAETTVKASNTQKDRFVIYRLCWYDIVVFASRDNFIFDSSFFSYLLFGYPTANFRPLLRVDFALPMVITELIYFRPEGHLELPSENGTISPTDHLVRFDVDTFWIDYNVHAVDNILET